MALAHSGASVARAATVRPMTAGRDGACRSAPLLRRHDQPAVETAFVQPADQNRAATDPPLPVMYPHTWLLAVGWRKHALIDPWAIPGGAHPSIRAVPSSLS
jgi:hypothetical protein